MVAPVRTAMVLAAGEGRRMRPLTHETPKPLLPVGGQPLLRRTLHWLAGMGFERIVVNTHHLAGQVEAALASPGFAPPGTDLRISHEDELLGTGGGIHRGLAHWLGDRAWVVNGDVVCDAPLRELEAGLPGDARALLVVRPDPRAAALGPVFLAAGQSGDGSDPAGAAPRPLAGLLQARAPGVAAGEPYMFTGVHLVHRELAAALPEPGCVVRDGYLPRIAEERLFGAVHGAYWNEIGTPDAYDAVAADWAAGRLPWLALP